MAKTLDREATHERMVVLQAILEEAEHEARYIAHETQDDAVRRILRKDVLPTLKHGEHREAFKLAKSIARGDYGSILEVAMALCRSGQEAE